MDGAFTGRFWGFGLCFLVCFLGCRAFSVLQGFDGLAVLEVLGAFRVLWCRVQVSSYG